MSEDKKSPTTPKQPEPKTDQAAANGAKKEGPGEQPNTDTNTAASQAKHRDQEATATPESGADKLKQEQATKAEPAEATAEKTESRQKAEPPQQPEAPKAAKAADTKSGNNGGGKPPADREQSSRGWWGALLVILLVLIFVGGLGGVGWWANERFQDLQQELEQSQADWQAEWQTERQGLLDNVQSVEQRLSQREEDVTDLLADIEQTRDDLVRLARQVNEQATLQDSDIQRLEIEYLLRTARHIALLTGDLRQAESLLRQADQMLAEFEDLAYLPVREALSQDIQRLREVPVPDVDGIYFELQALAERATTWQWWPETVDLSQPHRPEPAPADTWYEQAWQEVKDLITVRYRDDADQTRLAPSEFNQLQAQFRLLMNQAQVALMQGNQTLYDSSLEQAISWLEVGAGQVPQASNVAQQLNSLLDTTVTVERPEINRGLNRLQQMIRSETEESE